MDLRPRDLSQAEALTLYERLLGEIPDPVLAAPWTPDTVLQAWKALGLVPDLEALRRRLGINTRDRWIKGKARGRKHKADHNAYMRTYLAWWRENKWKPEARAYRLAYWRTRIREIRAQAALRAEQEQWEAALRAAQEGSPSGCTGGRA